MATEKKQYKYFITADCEVEIFASNKKEALEKTKEKLEGLKIWSFKVNPQKRTFNQNGWYWGVVLPLISETTGHTPNELDDIFEEMFAPKKIYKFNGKEIVRDKHCKDLTIGEFIEFIERIRAEVAGLGIIIPPAKKEKTDYPEGEYNPTF